ncbi:Soluble starch synthase 3, chloroplastic/amyloplastic-like protein [Drosera capensis]
MDGILQQSQSLFTCRPQISNNCQLHVKPFFGFFLKPPHSSKKEFTRHGLSLRISASADFQKKRQKKVSTSRPRTAAPAKGFSPKAPTGTGLQKQDGRNKGQDDSMPTASSVASALDDVKPETSDSGELIGSSQELRIDGEIDNTNGKVGERSTVNESVAIVSESQFVGDESIVSLDKSKNAGALVEAEVGTSAIVEIGLEKNDLDIVQVCPVAKGEISLGTVESVSGIEATRHESVSVEESLEKVVALLKADAETALVNMEIEAKSLAPTFISEVSEAIEAAEDKVITEVRGFENVGRLVTSDKPRSIIPSFETSLSEGRLGGEVRGFENVGRLVSSDKPRSIIPSFETSLSEGRLGGEVADIIDAFDALGTIGISEAQAIIAQVEKRVEGDEGVDNDGIYSRSETMIADNDQRSSVTKGGDGRGEGEVNLPKFDATAASNAPTKENEVADSSERLKQEMEAAMRRQVLEELAQENFFKSNKLFTYPKVVKAGEDVEVFLNRSLSPLKDEPEVLIMGAFNDWRWRSFTTKLNKSNLDGDWWSCQIRVPEEAYIIDFVFFNGRNVYDNNDGKDFHIALEGGMDPSDFEDFLLEEKQQELERLAREQAERDRKAEEQRRIEAEKAASEADRAQARAEVERQRNNLQEMIKKAPTSVANIWYFDPPEFDCGDLVKLFYNKNSGPLGRSDEIWVHGGHNGWQEGLSIVAKLVKSSRTDGEWWYAEVTVPDRAFVLDWVFANGPPQKASVYDNNNRLDFHAATLKSVADELYWVELEQVIFRKLQEARRAEKTARMKAEMKEKTLKRFLLSQKHIVYTDPLELEAGKAATVYYNPSNTVLNGKPEVWFRGSFNRWTHQKGPLSPQKMVPGENGSHVKTAVKIPLDAYVMDFVFSEKEDGGVFDNKDGMDYHVPVYGGITKESPMHIVHISVEMAPIAKVGGLGDVVTSLSRAVQDLNHNVDIVLPKYDCMNASHIKDLHYQRSYSWGGIEIKVWFGKVEGLSVYFLEPVNGFFSVGCIYGRNNDAQRFDFFCHAALEFLQQSGFHPDIIHCHDWSTAPVAWLFKDHYVQYGLTKARVVFTIHNLEFGAGLIGKAMTYADKATTVSPTYSKEIAGNPAIAPYLGKFYGILNGIDPDIWDPFNDKFIPVPYTSENVIEGKQAAKRALQQRLGIKVADIPVVGIISRLTHQKGIHLIKHAIFRTLERNGQVVLLGSAPDPRIQNDFVNLEHELRTSHSDPARLVLTYDEPLSHLIYAGADFIIVPSIFEPCGLTQLVAMRYGSIPIVRKTGGLYDTVFDVDHDKERAQAQGLEPNGFSFEGADTAGVDYALNRAISAWYNGREWFNSLCKRVMEQDWSWNRPALDYLELYYAARK